jgi:hypothetical protein
MRTATAILTLAMSLALAPAVGLAADAAPASTVKIQRGADGRRIYVVPPIVVRGKQQHPEAIFVYPRASVSYEWPELTRDLLRNVDHDAAGQIER